MPLSAAATANEAEMSSIFQPVRSIARAVVLVTSNQSTASGLLLLDHGATSEMNSLPTVPGEPISLGLLAATIAPLTPTALNSEMVALFRPAALLKVRNGGPVEDAPKATLDWSRPVES